MTKPAKPAQPATPLPWHVDGYAIRHEPGSSWRSPSVARTDLTHGIGQAAIDDQQNAAYIVEACNAYPQLLEDKRKLVDLAKAIVTAFGDIRFRSRTEDHLYEGARALLRELGETA